MQAPVQAPMHGDMLGMAWSGMEWRKYSAACCVGASWENGLRQRSPECGCSTMTRPEPEGSDGVGQQKPLNVDACIIMGSGTEQGREPGTMGTPRSISGHANIALAGEVPLRLQLMCWVLQSVAAEAGVTGATKRAI